MTVYATRLMAAAAFAASPFVPAAAAEAPAVVLSVSTNMTFEGSTQTDEEEAALHARARAELYRVAAGECSVVSQATNMDCRLRQIQVNTRSISAELGTARAVRDGVIATGTFTFGLTPRP